MIINGTQIRIKTFNRLDIGERSYVLYDRIFHNIIINWYDILRVVDGEYTDDGLKRHFIEKFGGYNIIDKYIDNFEYNLEKVVGMGINELSIDISSYNDNSCFFSSI